MNNIENIYACIAAPMLIAALFAGKRYRFVFLFVLCGMTVCLLSAYLNTFFARLYHLDTTIAAVEIAPVVEEILKFLPLLFYLLVFEPSQEKAKTAVILLATGFATFENICYMITYGTSNFIPILLRGLGTGAMHIVCGALVGYGLIFVWTKLWLKAAGTLGLLGFGIIYHALFNLLVCAESNVQPIGYALPAVTALLAITLWRNRGHLKQKSHAS